MGLMGAVGPGAMMQASAGTSAQKPDEIATAVATWRRLRPLQGHFNGGAWNPDLDRWQGPKHEALQRLAQHLLLQRASPSQVQRLLGPPDTQLRPGQAGHHTVVERLFASDATLPPSARQAQIWLYHWRGRHDQLALMLGQDLQAEPQQAAPGPSHLLATAWLHDLE